MGTSGKAKFSYLRRSFLVTHAAGLGAGAVFPFLAVPILGRDILTLPFFVICLLMGLTLGASLFLFMRATFKEFLRGQVERLRPLAGAAVAAGDSEEELLQTVETVIGRIDGILRTLFATVEELAPHYRNLSRSGQYLHDRAHEGLTAAVKTHEDVKGMEEKQRQIAEQMEVLSGRTQNEAALSRELSASLEEMAAAMEHSSVQFLETTSAVDEVASTVREVAGRANDIARSVEGTSQDLDRIGETLEKIRTGASASAQAVDEVKKDAENGLMVVKASMEEMERIEQESHKATAAMERLSSQTGEVAKIIEVIKELVSDTELLAFNAAIIAAKAGEEGKGFSVVAEEIRDLADRTTASAQDIHRIVKNIGGDTREVTAAVDATAMRIAKGKQMSLSAGEALTKIAVSSTQAAASSEEIASLTEAQGERARSLLVDVGRSLRSVQAVARAMQEQQVAIARIQEGVNQMKSASDQVARGMEEQVRANHEFDRGLEERESQIQAINEATRFQLETSQQVFAHFAKSQERLRTNAERAAALSREIALLESLTNRLRTHAADGADLRADGSQAPAPSPAA